MTTGHGHSLLREGTMMDRGRAIGPIAVVAAASFAATTGCSNEPSTPPLAIAPDSMPHIATVDERFQSYNVEMAEVIGGNFWKPYTSQSIAAFRAEATRASGSTGAIAVGKDTSIYQARPPIDLTNARLRKLAAALGPAYVRVSGTWANTVYFHDSNTPPPATPPNGFMGVLTRPQWRGVIDFAEAVNAEIVTSFAISAGVRDAAGVWTPVEAKPFLDFTRSVGGKIAAAAMFNEPTMPTYGGAPRGYDAESYARDFAVFRPFVKHAAPGMLILGPGSVGEGLSAGLLSGLPARDILPTPQLLSATPRPVFDVFSYHYYGAASIRCASLGPQSQTSADEALSNAWLSRVDTVNAYYEALRDQYQPGRKMWITEMADAACGGNPWASTFLDTFRYMGQLGRLAQRGVQAIFHNTLASSAYGLVDENTFLPRPNYWAALLWRRLMGAAVLDPGPSRPELHLYAHCLRNHPGGVTVLAINTSRTEPASVALPTASERFTLTAPKLEDTRVQLNGHELALGANDALPDLHGSRIPAGRIELAPASITFLAITDARNRSCR
jgi:hypothetical protein